MSSSEPTYILVATGVSQSWYESRREIKTRSHLWHAARTSAYVSPCTANQTWAVGKSTVNSN